MLAWMLYVIMVSALLSLGAFLAERAARLKRAGTRWIWLAAILASLALPTLVSSVAFELPNVLGEPMANQVVALRQATTLTLSPAVWMTGEPEPQSWRVADQTIRRLWLGVSAAMLLALVASGAWLIWRKRQWARDTVAGAPVYLTSDVGPAVVGLLRPSIAVPVWVKEVVPAQQAAVIAHEQAHLDARDPQLFTFALALLVFMPWNLPLWWQLRRLRYAIEIDCDARVIGAGVNPTHYGETLIAVGERQSAYVGAVAAMSESKSFLEERIEHMIRKPAKWRRLGAATLASISVALTALAAQVSPPNADTPVQQSAESARKERTEIRLPAQTLDRYVGTYQIGDGYLFKVRRDETRLLAQITGQPEFEIFPESETRFFWKVVDAQVEFAADGNGPATAATLTQNGVKPTWPRVDAAGAADIESALAARVQAQTAAPGSEQRMRGLVDGIASGNPPYADMSPELADLTRQQLAHLRNAVNTLGPVQSVEFRGVSPTGWDMYEVRQEKGLTQWRIHLSNDGRIDGALLQPNP
jgi:beta-lactamase regulating signal transducer with metallopeptidase domain